MSLESPFVGQVGPSPAQESEAAASRTAFENESSASAIGLADRVFHVDRPSWKPPGRDGGHVSRYLNDFAAVETFPSGKRTVVGSTLPLRVDSGSGLAPVSLTLKDAGEAYTPENPLVPVTIAKHLAEGITLAPGVTAVPVAAGGQAPILTGNSLGYANVARDTDLVIEPVPSGAEVAWQLRSQESPADEQLAFHLPQGVTLQSSSVLPGGAEVIAEGKPVVLIPPPVAQGADGRVVPASYSIAGDVLTTHVDTTGSVAFPVRVDPLLIGEYGAYNGANVWTNWQTARNNDGFGFPEYPNLIQAGTNPGPENNAYGEWYIYAPGAGSPGGAGITRVDLAGVTHQALNQSAIQGGISESNGSTPIYTFNGLTNAGNMPSPMNSDAALSEQSIAFCAQQGGGWDGGPQPLCDEVNDQGNAFWIADVLGPEPRTVYNYIRLAGAQITYRDETPPNEVTLVNVPSGWATQGPTGPQITAHDQGLGIQRFELKIPPGAGSDFFSEEIGCKGANGFSGCPAATASSPINFSSLKTGVYTLGAYATDAAGNIREAASSGKLYVDNTPPNIFRFAGPLSVAGGHVIGAGGYDLKFAAEDGNSLLPQVGMQSLQVTVDGKAVDTVRSTCSRPVELPAEYCNTLEGKWAMYPADYGAGQHTVSVVATDWLNNTSTRSVTVTVGEGASQAVGPGQVNLANGNFNLNATDVSLSGGVAPLSVSRSYDSRNAVARSFGPLGPDWALGLPDTGAAGSWQTLTPLPGGNVEAVDAHGNQVVFSSSGGGGFTAPAGYATNTLTLSGAEYHMTDAHGDVATFKQPVSGGPFVPQSVATPSGSGEATKTKYWFTPAAGGVTEPLKELAPAPPSVNCETAEPKEAPKVKGCRALTFNYATSTTATGESPSGWGDFTGRLTRVYFTAWSPEKAEMTTTVVAQYAYDSAGRLRAEWDPRIEPALKTVYGYGSDEAHLLTTVGLPGQQPWLLQYGTTPTDATPGRLLAAVRPAATTIAKLKEREAQAAPGSTVAPTFSPSSPVVGTTIRVEPGTWSHEPLSYSYQWEHCATICMPIPGATNQTYTPQESDVNAVLAARVTAYNEAGARYTVALMGSTVPPGKSTNNPPPAPPAVGTNSVWTIEYGVSVNAPGAANVLPATIAAWGQTDYAVEGTAIFPPDEPMGWPASSYKRAPVDYLDEANHTVDVLTPGGGLAASEYDANNNLKWSLTADNRSKALEAGSKSVEEAARLDTQLSYSSDGTELLSSLGPEHAVKLASGALVQARKHVQHTYDQGAPGGGPYRLVTTTTEGAQVAGQEEKDIHSTTTSYSGQSNLGWTLRLPTSTTADPNGLKVTTSTTYDATTGNVTETKQPAASSEAPPVYSAQFGSFGSGSGQMKAPKQIALDAKGRLWIADEDNSRLDVFTAAGVIEKTVGSLGSGVGQFKEPKGIAIDSHGNVWVADTGNSRLEEFNEKGEAAKAFGSAGTGHLQFKEPRGLAIDKANDVVVADTGNNRVEILNELGAYLNSFGATGSGNGQFKAPKAVALDSHGNIYVSDGENNRVQEFNEAYGYVAQFGTTGAGNGQFKSPKGITIDSHNNKFVSDGENNRVEEFNEANIYKRTIGAAGSGNGQFKEPWGIQAEPSGTIVIGDAENGRIEKFKPGNPLAHATQTVYYTSGPEATVAGCRNHQEWAGLACQAQPAEPPETSGQPGLPTTTYGTAAYANAYNVWDEPLTTTDTSGSATRSTTLTYDNAGRRSTAAITSSLGTALTTVTSEYNATLGSLASQSRTTAGVTKTLKDEFNTLGQLVGYTDADGNNTAYAYDVDGRPKTTTDAKGTQTITYNLTTGLPSTLEDSAAGIFTASFDPEGAITKQTYPNGMTASYTRDATGQQTKVEYLKTTHCSANCEWYKDSIVPSIRGQVLSQTSTFGTDEYNYDSLDRLNEVQDTPAGKACTARAYSYDEDGNRTSLSTREPCSAIPASSSTNTYDTADRLIEAGIAYDAFGNTTTLPASEAGGTTLTSSYYADNRLATLTQNGETIGYNLDPSERTRETVSTGKTNTAVISHYDGPGDSPAWTEEPTSGHWTRNIPGLDGNLAAIEKNNGGAPTTEIQLANLHGDIIGTAIDTNETETKLLNATDTTEYGVPRTATPEKYSWNGAEQRPTELPTGIIAMGARGYIPQIGRFLQTDPQPGGSSNPYGYTNGDPVNEADPTGGWTTTVTYNEEAVGSGEGTKLSGGVGIAAGAIMPPPVNMQIEEEFAANPPWDAEAEYTARIYNGKASFGTYHPIFDMANRSANGTGGGESRYRRRGIWEGTYGHTAPPDEGQHSYWRSNREFAEEVKLLMACALEALKTGQCHG